jgi:class 6 POU domain transcription factor
MPQFILASGQLVQGIQGAQLLIPTSQGMVHVTISFHNFVEENW